MAAQIRLRRGTAAQWTSANPTLDEGEVGVETDTSKLKIGDGVTAWNSLAYQGPSGPTVDISSVEKGGIVVGSAAGEIAFLPVGADGTVLGVDSSDPTTVGWVALNLDVLSDVAVSAPAAGDLLQFDGSSWGNVTDVSVLTANRAALTALVWGVSAGYFSRGNNSTAVYKWAFPADTVSTTSAAPVNISRNAGFANPAVAGYFNKGAFDDQGNISTAVYKLLLSVDSFSSTSNLAYGADLNAGFANPAVAGYFSRGQDLGGQATTQVTKLFFPSDTVGLTTAAPAGMQYHAGFSNPSVAGYMSQGGFFNGVYKWAFPADTVSTTTAAPTAMGEHAGFANPTVAGYFSRGNNNTTVYKWAFPADTVSTTTAAPAGMHYHAGFANPAVAGYFSRGNNNTTVYKWAFPADTVSTTTPAPATMDSHAGFANGY